ncbi:hypothetical protein AB0F01_31210, partial [Streptomyces sp. NPDC029526]
MVAPVFGPLGFGWCVNVGLLSAQGAREAFVAPLGQVAAEALERAAQVGRSWTRHTETAIPTTTAVVAALRRTQAFAVGDPYHQGDPHHGGAAPGPIGPRLHW